MPRPTLNDDDRAQRRRQLLDAAHELYQRKQALPTVAEIAQAAGVAKGTVYLSFGTKEEIFIALLEDSFSQLLVAMLPLLQQLPSQPEAVAQTFATHYVACLRTLPDLLPMAALTNSVLEKNLPLDAMLEFKTRLMGGLDLAGAQLDAHLPGLLPARSGSDLLRRTWALTQGLWQMNDCPQAMKPHLIEALNARGVAHAYDRDFFAELQASLTQLWRGALLAGPRGA